MVKRLIARFFTGFTGKFFLGLALFFIGHMVAELSESYKFINQRKIEFERMKSKSIARVSNVYLNVVNNVKHWGGHDDAKAFELIFFEWIQSVVKLKKNQVVAFDGKKVSGTFPCCGSEKGQALSLLNIWAVSN